MNIVAELSCNHCGKFDLAVELIRAAHWAGANTVKVQMFKPEEMADPEGETIQSGLWKGQTLYELYQKAQTPYDWIPTLKQVAEKLGLKFMVSVYHPDTVDLTEEMGVEHYKIASHEILYEDLFKRVAKTGKEVYFSAGGASLPEIYAATRWMTPVRKKMWILHCAPEYPASIENMNLRTLYDLSKYCMGRVGLSDHSQGIVAPVVAATMGAQVIEKHLKVNETCLDKDFSLTPQQFKNMTEAVRQVSAAEGTICYRNGEAPPRFRRQLVNGKWLRK